MTLLFVYGGIALGVSFLCSILEAALLSITPSYVAKLEQDRPKMGARIRALKVNIDRPLAAILSLNTIAHTVGAMGAGAQAIIVFTTSVRPETSSTHTLTGALACIAACLSATFDISSAASRVSTGAPCASHWPSTAAAAGAVGATKGGAPSI